MADFSPLKIPSLGGTDSMGCAKPDFCHHGDFCPIECGADELMCTGQYDWATGKQVTQDTCQPMKNGDCYAHCPVNCNEVSFFVIHGRIHLYYFFFFLGRDDVFR